MVKAIVGANWGDEGKGKITDLCAKNADIVIRFQGGSNAGHTIINEWGKFALHQLPSGIFSQNVMNIIANGVALNVEYLMKEMEGVKQSGVPFQLMISNRAQVLMPYHVLLDVYEEERLGDKKFGSTKSGIAPFYADKYSKTGFQVWELFESSTLQEKCYSVCEKTNILFKHLYGKDPLDPEEMFQTLLKYKTLLEPFVADTNHYIHQALKENKNIFLEGQLGALKDTDHGIYPYVTSSSTLAGYACVGAGIPPYQLKEIIAVTKAYSSAVGESPFVAELFGEEGEELRKRGGDAGEYGATTGRPRRVGYFDAVATRYGCMVQGATQVALTGLDVLSYLSEIPVITHYEIDGQKTDAFPTTEKLYQAKPVYATLPGWKKDIRGVNTLQALPEEAKAYVDFIQKQIGVPITMISTGPKREEIIYNRTED